MKPFLRVLLPLLAIGIGVISCIVDDDHDCTCRPLLVSVPFYILNAGFAPETDFVLTIGNERTGEHYDVTQPSHVDGLYHALNDQFRRRLKASGDPIFVYGEDGTRSFIVDFVIGIDDCGCHIRKISGPDTVVVVP